MEEEIWKTIEDYPNYDVSSFGNIRNNKTNYIMKLQKNIQGYMRVSLINLNKKSINCYVHRLVAKTFIKNPENKPTVNHIDGHTSNNNLKNLEWATMTEQNNHKCLCKRKMSKPINYISVFKIDIKNENVIEEYISISDAAKWIIDNKLTTITEYNKNNISIISSKICAVANNKRKVAYGYKWKYSNTNTCLIDEIWKEIPSNIVGINNYFVSNLGRFKNNKGKIKYNYKYSSGYKRISINRKSYLLHRLIELTFSENPENKKCVNHKDGNKINNSLDNLEWNTCLENNIHKINSGLSNCTKKIIQYDTNMKKISEYDSIVKCSRILNISSSCISDNCRGKTTNTKCGYIFRYA
jgi:hypothetical protein